MIKSDRIKLISEIAESLFRKPWSLIDITLREFNFPTKPWDDDDMYSYVMLMIEDGDDQKLLDLASHLGLEYADSSSSISVSPSKAEELIKEINSQKTLMISVSTGGQPIKQVNEEYKERRLLIISSLKEIGIQDPNPYGDLWNWYGKWSDGSLPTYASRRSYITSLFQPLLDNLMLLVQRKSIEQIEPTGWERVDRVVEKIVKSLETAVDEEDFQAVGLLCREAIISLAQVVYNPELHPSFDGVKPSDVDAKRMLESYIATELEGGSNEELRKYAKDALQLAVALQHKRTAEFRETAICVEATRSLINIIAIISGRRDP